MPGKFGMIPQQLPNYGFTCPQCKQPILIYMELPILPEEIVETTFDLECLNAPCLWKGTLRGRDAYPYPPLGAKSG